MGIIPSRRPSRATTNRRARSCAPWGIGAHVHYPRYEYVAPDAIYVVEFSDYDDEQRDSYWYDEAKAQARADELNHPASS